MLLDFSIKPYGIPILILKDLDSPGFNIKDLALIDSI